MSLPGFSALINAWWFLLLVPLIIFYFLKLQRPRIEIPSLALWRQVINDQRVNSPFQKFKRNLLLLLQAAARQNAATAQNRYRCGEAVDGSRRDASSAASARGHDGGICRS